MKDISDLGLVSIITPTYNCGPFIAETVESERNQPYTNWEMLIIDDCSTDNTNMKKWMKQVNLLVGLFQVRKRFRKQACTLTAGRDVLPSCTTVIS